MQSRFLVPLMSYKLAVQWKCRINVGVQVCPLCLLCLHGLPPQSIPYTHG